MAFLVPIKLAPCCGRPVSPHQRPPTNAGDGGWGQPDSQLLRCNFNSMFHTRAVEDPPGGPKCPQA